MEEGWRTVGEERFSNPEEEDLLALGVLLGSAVVGAVVVLVVGCLKKCFLAVELGV